MSVLDTDDPNFADAPAYWTTELNEDGHFIRTGCTTPVKDNNTPAPTAPATGTCPAPEPAGFPAWTR